MECLDKSILQAKIPQPQANYWKLTGDRIDALDCIGATAGAGTKKDSPETTQYHFYFLLFSKLST
jgi:hypothetical protein